MAQSLDNYNRAYEILRNYSGKNPFISKTKYVCVTSKFRAMNDFECDYILRNAETEPVELNKIVMITEWYGNSLAEKYSIDFVPRKVKITWFMGEGEKHYHAYCIYRLSQTEAIELFIPKSAVLTDFLAADYTLAEIDFEKYFEKSGRALYPHQEEGVKFLVTRKKAILADVMGFGKTSTSIVAALESGYQKILIICPASLKTNWRDELCYYVDEDEVTIVDGKKWKENRFTVINYDILRNFYTLPTETVKEKKLNMDMMGNTYETLEDREVISRKKSVIDNAMKDSQLFQSKFDLIIIDEAHRLSNKTSGVFKIVSDLVKRSNPTGIFELSGTIMTNRPINLYNMLKIIDAPISRDWKNFVLRYCDGKVYYNQKEKKIHTAVFCRQKGKNNWYALNDQEKDELDQILEAKCKKIWITDGASNLDELRESIKTVYMRRDKTDLELVKKTIIKYDYALTRQERSEYNMAWDKYVAAKGGINAQDNVKLEEGIVFRQWLANTMTTRTIPFVEDLVEQGNKVVVFTSFDEELKRLKDAFGDKCVVHNGKMTIKQKDKSIHAFQNDDQIRILIGNIRSAGVGLNLTVSNTVVFNSIDFVPGNVLQCEDRIHRLNQDKDCFVYYQTFRDTYMEHMFDIIHQKSEVIDQTIVNERNK